MSELMQIELPEHKLVSIPSEMSSNELSMVIVAVLLVRIHPELSKTEYDIDSF